MNAVPPNPLEELDAHLDAETARLEEERVLGRRHEREGDLDMNDEPEAAVLTPFPNLKDALDFLATGVKSEWEAADSAALHHQKWHRRVARTSILFGTAAVVFAVIQLALKHCWATGVPHAAVLEGVAVAAASLAVLGGVWAKFDRNWLGQRHRAERLRMLKFVALGSRSLWSGDLPEWKRWVNQELLKLKDAGAFRLVKKWSEEEPLPRQGGVPPGTGGDFQHALAVYYRHKRLNFQADYFSVRHRRLGRQVGRSRWWNLRLFLVSVLAVVAHFFADRQARQLLETSQESAAAFWEVLAVVCLAAAAILPVLSFGIRAWYAAFEEARSAILYGAKERALARMSDQLGADIGAVPAACRHIEEGERFLEGEHREWLRLLLEAEWFL
ncbi:MAG: hypothetical protein ABIH26_13205 [Candidatus Eisenbacteria bacterium]